MAQDTVIGVKLVADGSGAMKTMGEFKKEIKEATSNLLNMRDKFGETSKEALNAAKRVAELKDRLGDAKQLVDSFNPDQKFRALSSSLTGVLGGFTAITGAMGLMGVESAQVQRQLLKVQSAMALSQGLNQIGESIQSFKNLASVIGTKVVAAFSTLKGAILTSGVGALVVLVGVLTKAWMDANEKQKAYTDAAAAGAKAVATFESTVRQMSISVGLAKKGIGDKKEVLKEYNEKLGTSVGFAKNLDEAERNMAENTATYVQALRLRTTAVELYRAAAEKEADITTGAAGKLSFWQNIGVILEGAVTGDVAGVMTGKAVNNINEATGDMKKLNTKADSLIEEALVFEKKMGKVNRTIDPTTVKTDKKVEGEEIKSAFGRNSGKLSTADNADGGLAAEMDRKMAIIKKGADLEKDLNKGIVKSYEERSEREAVLTAQRIKDAELEREQKVQAAQNIGNALGVLSELIGRQTAAGKALGIAQAGINMWIGVSEVLREKTLLPDPLATISKVASIATIVGSGLMAIRNIVKVKVPGQSGGGSVPSASVAPIANQVGFTNTRLDANQINKIGNATVRAFVVEHDVTNNQEKIRRINRAARI